MCSILDQYDCIKILQNLFKRNMRFIKSELCPASENVEGFMGEHYILKITHKIGNIEETVSFFLKTKPRKIQAQLDIINSHNYYGKEVFLYNFLFKEFEKLGFYTSFAPRGYYCKGTETIVMEDLKEKEFQFAKNKLFDIEHCKVCLKALAYYHANCIAYEEIKSKELGRVYRINEESPVFNEVFFVPDDTDGVGFKYMQSTKDCFINLLQFMPLSIDWKKNLEEKIRNFDCAKIFNKQIDYRKTCIHGDLWLKNLLFKYSNDIPTHCVLIDFQILRYHHPSYDVILFIHTNTRRGFRKQHFTQLLDYYYNCFEEILHDAGLKANDLLPKEHILETAKYLQPVALIQALADRTFTFLPTEVANSAVNEDEKDNFEGLLFKDRPRLVADIFQKDNEVRDILIDDIYDLEEIIPQS